MNEFVHERGHERDVAASATQARRSRRSRGHVEFRLATAWREREALIGVRTQAYRDAGKHGTEAPMTDHWDARSILVGVYRDGVPVACARVIDCDAAEEWEHDRFVTWQPDWPARAECVEISRFCTLPSARDWAVICALGEGLGHAMLRLGKRHAIACCTDELKRLYRVFFGVHFTDVSIVHSDLGNRVHHMFLMDLGRGMRGDAMGFLAWATMWPRVTLAARRHCVQGQDAWARPPGRTLARAWIGLLLQPLARALVSRLRARRPSSARRRARGHGTGG